MTKVFDRAEDAIADIVDGSTVHIGGFAGPYDMPRTLIRALVALGVKNLSVVSAGAGRSQGQVDRYLAATGPILDPDGHVVAVNPPRHPDYCDIGPLMEAEMISHIVTTYAAEPRSGQPDFPVAELVRQNKVTAEIVPLGTFVERIRAGKVGIPAFYCPVGVGSGLSVGKEERTVNGTVCLLEEALYGDFAIVRADVGDPFGNLGFRGMNRSLNSTMAGSARVTIVEVGELLPEGLDPDCIMVPGPYVDRIVVVPDPPIRFTE